MKRTTLKVQCQWEMWGGVKGREEENQRDMKRIYGQVKWCSSRGVKPLIRPVRESVEGWNESAWQACIPQSSNSSMLECEVTGGECTRDLRPFCASLMLFSALWMCLLNCAWFWRRWNMRCVSRPTHTNERTNGRADLWWMGVGMDGWMGVGMDGWMWGWMDVGMDGWMDGWMDEWNHGCSTNTFDCHVGHCSHVGSSLTTPIPPPTHPPSPPPPTSFPWNDSQTTGLHRPSSRN